MRQALGEGLSVDDMMARFKCSDVAIYRRVKKLGLMTLAAAVSPAESERVVAANIDAIVELTESLKYVKKLRAATDEWLQDANDPEKYDIGARAEEVLVTYWHMDESGGDAPKPVKMKRRLSELIQLVETKFAVDKVESRHADPRELILKTAQEVRQTVSTAADVLRTMYDINTMEELKNMLFDALERADPTVASNIARELQSNIILEKAFTRP